MKNIFKHGFFYGWYIVIACWIMVFLQYSVSFSIFFKPILEEFNWDRATLSSVQSIGFLVFTVTSPFLGRLLDKVRPRIMMAIGTFSQIASVLLTGFASSIWYLLFARFFSVISVYPAAQVLIDKWFFRLKGTALSVVSSAVPAGTLLLSPLTQFLILSWNWRLTLLFWSAIMFIVIIPLLFVIRNKPEDKALKPYGKVNHEGTSARSKEIASFGRVTTHEVEISEAIKSRAFWFLSISQLACGIACGFMGTHIVIFAIDAGFNDMIGASLVSIQGGFNLIGIFALGYLSDRIVRKNSLALTYLIRFLAFFMLLIFTFTASDSLLLLYIAVAFFGIGWFTTAPLTGAVAADLFGNLRLGTIIGITNACHMFGMATGSYLGGVIYDNTGSYFLFFLIQAPLELMAALLVFFIKQRKK